MNPIQAIDMPVREERRVPEADEGRAKESEAAVQARDESVRKEALAKEDLGKNIDETA